MGCWNQVKINLPCSLLLSLAGLLGHQRLQKRLQNLDIFVVAFGHLVAYCLSKVENVNSICSEVQLGISLYQPKCFFLKKLLQCWQTLNDYCLTK